MPRDRYSLMMSFWVVPLQLGARRALLVGDARRRARAARRPVALMVIEVFISASGMPLEQRRACRRDGEIGTPTLPTSPRGEQVVAVVAGLGRQIEGDREAGLALGEVLAVERVRLCGGRMARHRCGKSRACRASVCAIRPSRGYRLLRR